MDGALYHDLWNVRGELPQLEDPESAAIDQDQGSDSEEEVAPPEDVDGPEDPPTTGALLGKRFTEDQRRILLEAFSTEGKVS